MLSELGFSKLRLRFQSPLINKDLTTCSNKSINFHEKLNLFHEQWQPKVVAEMNNYQFKLEKIQGDFIWHDHKDTDETFLVLDGLLRIDFRDGSVDVAAGEMFVVPEGRSAQTICRI